MVLGATMVDTLVPLTPLACWRMMQIAEHLHGPAKNKRVGVQGMESTFILRYNHLLTNMWRHASAEGLTVYSFLTSIPHYPVA